MVLLERYYFNDEPYFMEKLRTIAALMMIMRGIILFKLTKDQLTLNKILHHNFTISAASFPKNYCKMHP